MASRQEDTKFYRAIRKYGEENFYIELLETVPIQDLNEREKYWINYYDSYNNGYNSTLGGDGILKLDYNFIYKEWLNGKSIIQISRDNNIDRNTISRILKNEFNVASEDIKIRANENNMLLSKDFILSQWDNGLTPNQIVSQFGGSVAAVKKILYRAGITEKQIKHRIDENQQILKDNQIIDFWNEGLTLTDIVKHGGNFRTIHNILLQNGITEEYINNRKRQVCNQNAKSVVQLSLNNEYINTFSSCKKAGESLGKPSSSINGCCNHKPKYKTAYGYKWIFEEEYINMKEGSKNGTQ